MKKYVIEIRTKKKPFHRFFFKDIINLENEKVVLGITPISSKAVSTYCFKTAEQVCQRFKRSFKGQCTFEVVTMQVEE